MNIRIQCCPPCANVTAQPLPQPPPSVPSSTGSQIVSSNWTADVVTTIADPGSGDVRWNTANQYDATRVLISTIDRNGADVKLGLKAAISGDIIYIQQQNDSSVWMKYRITGAPIDHTTWIEYPVAAIDHAGGPFSNNQALLIAVN